MQCEALALACSFLHRFLVSRAADRFHEIGRIGLYANREERA